MNVQLLQEIKARILAEPDAFRMDEWSCGTAHCIAGWACALVGNPVVIPTDSIRHRLYTADGRCPGDVAAEALGIDAPSPVPMPDEDEWEESQADALFHVEVWPEQFAGPHFVTEYDEEGCVITTIDARRKRAEIAAARIDHFIATDGKE